MSVQMTLFDDLPAPARIALERELILASAGSGKTYRIASSIAMLLAHGARPDEVFASTFTRKAAAEILERVLARLAAAALDDARAATLAADTGIEGGTRGFWLGVLERTVRELHRLNIGTLDAFIVRSVRSFGHDLGLPPTWEIADEPTAARIRAEALDDVLGRTDPGVLVELVRAIARNRARNSVHGALLREAEQLLAIHEALDPAARAPWSALERVLGTVSAADPAVLNALADRIARLQPPLTGQGSPLQSWVKSLTKSADAVRRGALDEFVSNGIAAKILCGETEFSRQPIEGEVLAAFQAVFPTARAELGRMLAAQARALGRFAALYAVAVDRRRRAAGAFRFDDLTRMLGGTDALAERPDLFYRLDMQTRHILLDEFQDTSLAQWEALEPLIDELLSGHAGERAAVIVADPKQSIYGWRGATPLIVDQVRDRYALDGATLAKSWRSSPVVLDAVNRIFHSLERLPIWETDPVGGEVAAQWKRHFPEHLPAQPELPGYAALHVGPPDEGRGESRPRLCRHAAELAARLHAQSPGASIGVLTRTNAAAARILFELKRLGVRASGEGGTPLTDTAPVAALLALLRLADHPADSIARYHVALSPVGDAIGLADWRDVHAARRLAHTLRGRLLDAGYGRTLATLAAEIEDACDARERRRVAQLVELAFRFDERATLRPTDFVRLVEAEAVEDPTAADVRVMTVHQSKGLEFDVVVLPQLDVPLTRVTPTPLAYRPTPVSRVGAVYPFVRQAFLPLFEDVPELIAARAQAHGAAMRDALSGLYVALTRARHALHIVVKPDGTKRSTTKSAALLVRDALAPDRLAVEGDVLYEHGDAGWFAAVREARSAAAAVAPPAAASAVIGKPPPARPPAAVPLRAAGVRTRVLPRRSPSDLEGGETVQLRHVLRLDAAAFAERGTVAHAWFERVGWLEDGAPTDEELLAIARRVAPAMTRADVDALAARFRAWLDAPATRAALGRADVGLAAGESADVEREVPFLQREGETVLEGIVDRLVLVRRDGRVVRARILDYKTDALEPGDAATLAARTAFYRPQLEAYQRAVAALYRLPAGAVDARLLFLDPGVVQ